MFTGHLALAFAARPQVKKPGLGLLLLAVSWADLVWPIFLLLGLERVRIAPGITCGAASATGWRSWGASPR